MNMKNTLLKAAAESGKILKHNFGREFEISFKEVDSNLVTEVDKLSENKIIEIIKNDFPGHCIISEEAGEIYQESEYKWIIDPIDGTVNYAHSIPLSSVSIALEKSGDLILGVVLNPFSDELFFSEKNSGAFLNDKKISVSACDRIEKSLLVTGFPYNSGKFLPNPLDLFGKFLKRDIPIRRLGSAALDLCWTACGRFEGFWEYNLNAWDVAAGVLILREAGGKVTNLKGEKFNIYGKEILATNSHIHDAMLSIINS
ncbi:MAG: Inositol-1-monophosphatase [Ignavibacteria bacterium]|nr:Inositol-1-monophosphatase [Ignavibacteria bacterium]